VGCKIRKTIDQMANADLDTSSLDDDASNLESTQDRMVSSDNKT